MVLRVPGNSALDKWKELARAQKAPSDARLYKEYIAEIKAEGDGTYTFVISTASVDRDYDTLAVDGWQLENYLKNPVVLWAHNYAGLPVGQAIDVSKGGGALVARMRFVPAETYPLAGMVQALVDGGFLRATSVGFRPMKYLWNDERGGYDFVEQELLEFSIVPVPANPEALIAASAGGIDLMPLKAWAEGVLDGIEPGLWLPKAAAERALELVAESHTAEEAVAAVNAQFEKARTRTRLAKSADGKGFAIATPEKAPTKEPFVLPAFMNDEGKIRAAIRAATTDAVTQQVRRAQGRLD